MASAVNSGSAFQQLQSGVPAANLAVIPDVVGRPVAAGVAAEMAMLLGFDGSVGSDGVPAPWQLKVKVGIAEVKNILENGEKALHLVCKDSSFAVERQINVNVADYRRLAWKWKAVHLPPQGDLRNKGANDQGLQLLLAFAGRKTLSYVWDSNAPEGTVSDESIGWPVNMKIKVMSVKTGAADEGKWITFSRNVYDDYRTIFGEAPGAVQGVRVQSNTQYTHSVAEGYVGNIVFSRIE
ncbi:MAG: DUF3047 domain-containing protein [Elusimicrobia bacterium]|nr:DUF3047 domain-containing protein [Elusimicrobiota bacterium]